jgi:hypothetical protein
MKIARILADRVELPLVEGSYRWSGGKSVSVFDSTIVAVETACGPRRRRASASCRVPRCSVLPVRKIRDDRSAA